MKKRRAKRKVNWTLLLSLAAVGNTLLGFQFSTATAPSVIKIAGAPDDDRVRIERIVKTLRGTPAKQVDQLKLASQIAANPELESSRSMFNLFGRGRLDLKRKEIVAQIAVPAGKPGEPVGPRPVLARDGSIFLATLDESTLPTLEVDPNLVTRVFCLAGGWESERIAFLAQEIRTKVENPSWKISVDSRGVISLTEKARGKVIFGTTHQLTEKVDKFVLALTNEPKLLNQVQELNVSSPKDVVIKP